ncbi:MAG: hypothetical protein ACNS62_10465 [Candidatus Cyclobacteriaceae bacterium M3_2C_046]
MRKLSLLFLLVAGLVISISSCDDDGDPIEPGVISIAGIPATATIDFNGTLGPVTATVTAEDGLSQLTINKDGSNFATEQLSGESATYDFSYTPDPAEEGSNIVFEFIVEDEDGDQAFATHVLTVREFEPTYTVIDATEERGPDEDNTTSYPQNEVTGIINEDFTFTNDVVWVLNGRVIVDAGATLTIDPGTIVKAGSDQGASSSVLLVAIGGKLNAVGNPEEPIVFTSVDDNINVAGLAYYDGSAIVENGDGFTSTLDVDLDFGKWGGVIILGDAPISADGASTVIEGIPSSVSQAAYGGSNAEHDGGILQYASIRFTGTQLGPGNELQGLTLGGVGTGTTIDHVESIASADDGIEIFGGTVEITNFIVWGQEDDGYDADQAWTGSVDNFIYLGTNATADHAFELDGPEGADKGIGTFRNGIAWGANSSGMADLRDDAEYTLENIFFFRFGADADIELDEDDDSFTNSANYIDDETTTFTGLQFRENGKSTLEAIMDAKGDTYADAADTKFADAANNNEVIADDATPTVGADVSVFGWSYTAQEFAGWSVLEAVSQ